MQLGLRAVVALLLLLASTAFAYRNEPEGHRKMNWGDKVSDRKDMVLISMGAMSQYERPGDELFMEESNVTLTKVAYNTVGGKLVEITEDVLFSDTEAAKEQLEKIHGTTPCLEYMGCMTICSWPGRITSIQLEMTSDKTVVRYRSKEHEREWAQSSPPVLGLPSGIGGRNDGTGF